MEIAADFHWIETYQYTDKTRRLHTDFVTYIGDASFCKDEIENLPYDADEEIDTDVFVMDREEYNNTICANCESDWGDYFPYDEILVIVVR